MNNKLRHEKISCWWYECVGEYKENSRCSLNWFFEHADTIHSADHRHYCDVIMGAVASQITSLTIVFSTVYSDTDQRIHQSSASLAFVRGNHRNPVNSPHKWPVTRKMFPFDDVIMVFRWCMWVHPGTPLPVHMSKYLVADITLLHYLWESCAQILLGLRYRSLWVRILHLVIFFMNGLLLPGQSDDCPSDSKVM